MSRLDRRHLGPAVRPGLRLESLLHDARALLLTPRRRRSGQSRHRTNLIHPNHRTSGAVEAA